MATKRCVFSLCNYSILYNSIDCIFGTKLALLIVRTLQIAFRTQRQVNKVAMATWQRGVAFKTWQVFETCQVVGTPHFWHTGTEVAHQVKTPCPHQSEKIFRATAWLYLSLTLRTVNTPNPSLVRLLLYARQWVSSRSHAPRGNAGSGRTLCVRCATHDAERLGRRSVGTRKMRNAKLEPLHLNSEAL